MECLYAPWRSHYIESNDKTKLSGVPSGECVFCYQLQHNNDQANFILQRYKHTAVLFNRYPYNAGHLLIVPLEHIAHLEHLSSTARAEFMEVASICTTILQKKARPEGFNLGINMGKASGASIPSHLHMHVLPRWLSDTNFLPTISEIKVISSDLEKMYLDLKPEFDAHKI